MSMTLSIVYGVDKDFVGVVKYPSQIVAKIISKSIGEKIKKI